MKIFLVLSFIVTSALAQVMNPDLPDPATLTKKYLEELSKRSVGQSQFVVKSENWQEEQQEEQQGQDQDRDIQESDVYKIGKKGSKELFLLNNYRGFQVISFKDGLDKPRMIGRLPIHNNWSSEMYYLEDKDKVLILNTEWTGSDDYWSSNYNTNIYLLDVSNSEEPKIIKEQIVPGYLSTSRLVGDVLYAVTSNRDYDKTKAMITSLKIETDTITEVDKKDLNGPSRWVREMNVVKYGEKYYVLSTLSKWGDGDYVNVHNISSTKGKILKVMTAQAMGSISEKSQVFLHKDHLFSVSNYAKDGQPARIAVEAYPLIKGSAVVTSKDAQRVTIGDTTGLNTSLQDVRTSGDLLYTFWVPANNIDPFDLLDISNPAQGLKHLGQLQFEGWVSKAFPIEFEGRKFVLGLGWMISPTSEDGKRFPQAKLFEIKKVGETYKHEEVGSLTMNSDDVWGDLNAEDKDFSIIQPTPGVYNILFPITFAKDWKDGAKILSANMNTLALEEGASIIGDQAWLRKVFVNEELSSVHAFGNMNLASYNQSDMTTRGIAKAVSVLELARNIIDFHVLSPQESLQMVRSDKTVELRKVAADNSDAEKTEILGNTILDGNYSWHKIKEGKLYLITAFYKPADEDESEWNRDFDYAQLNTVELSTMNVSTERIDLELTQEQQENMYFSVDSTSTGKEELLTIEGNFYRINGTKISRLAIAPDCKYFFDTKSYSLDILNMEDELYAYNSFEVRPSDVPEEDQEDVYNMPFYKKLLITDNDVTCSVSVNTPGIPVLKKNDYVVAAEETYDYGGGCSEDYQDQKGINYSYGGWDDDYSKTFSLKYKNDKEIEIVEILNKDITSTLFNNGFITYNENESRVDIWSITADGEFISKPQFLNYEGDDSRLIAVKKFSDRNFLFMKDSKKVDVFEITTTNRINKIEVTSSHDSDLSDGSAEFIFDISSIAFGADAARFHIAQGEYGMTDIIFK